MVEVLILFGSKSDAKHAAEITTYLDKRDVSYELAYLSAHRTPKELEAKIKQTDAKVIIAGAGLSCALPGTVAAQTLKPVIGLPLSGNYGGLDALLACHQMPSGIPVMGAGIDHGRSCAEYAERFLHKKISKVVIIKRDETVLRPIEKALVVLKEFGLEAEVVEKVATKEENTIYLDFIPLVYTMHVDCLNCLILFVPCLENSSTVDASSLPNLALSHALFLGLNRGDNAALAAIQIMALNNPSLSEKFAAYREKKKQALLQN